MAVKKKAVTKKKVSAKKTAYKWPKTPGACADYGYNLRVKRAALTKLANAMETEEKALKKYMFTLLGRSKLTGAKGRQGQFNMLPKDVPTMEDFSKLLKFAARTVKGEMPYSAILQQRLNAGMISQMWDDNKDVPGVGSIEVLTGNFTKL